MVSIAAYQILLTQVRLHLGGTEVGSPWLEIIGHRTLA